MPVYVQLINWTPQGASAAKDTVQRSQRARAQAEKLGIRFRDIVWTMGRYDAVAIFEAPNDETASKFSIWLGTVGSARTETLRGYSEQEIAKIVEGL